MAANRDGEWVVDTDIAACFDQIDHDHDVLVGQVERQVAEVLDLHERWVGLAISFYAAHPDEVDERIAANEAAMERAREMAERHEQLLA